jgi:DNA/RNA endonuclease YhcR with UshA esterase domain
MTDMISVSGAAASVQYITRDGRGYRLAKSIEKADILNLNVGGKNATLIKDKSLPLVNEGDDVEVTGVVNSKSGWLEVVVLKNSTSSAEWKLSRARVRFGF